MLSAGRRGALSRGRGHTPRQAVTATGLVAAVSWIVGLLEGVMDEGGWEVARFEKCLYGLVATLEGLVDEEGWEVARFEKYL